MVDLQWILQNSHTVKNVIASAMSQETREDIQDLTEVLHDGAEQVQEVIDSVSDTHDTVIQALSIFLDVIHEPLEQLGFSVPSARSGISPEAISVKRKLLTLQERE